MLIAAESGPERLSQLILEDGTTVQNQAYLALRQALMSGRFRPGEEISLRTTAAALGTSVTPVREALRRLESEGGLVVQGPNRVLAVPFLSLEALIEIRTIRIQLEGMATETASGRMTSRHLRLIRNACALMETAAAKKDADAYLEHNWRFHSAIYQAARQPILLELIEGLWVRVGPLIRLALARPGHLAHSMECHREAERAMQAGDGPAARTAIERDIGDAAQDIAQLLLEETQEKTRA